MSRLSDAAKAEALRCFHGYVMKTEANIQEIIAYFPGWTIEEANGNWYAAFVYHCCRKAEYKIPIRPCECVCSHLAGCGAWEEWAKADPRIEYYDAQKEDAPPKPGDIVLFDRVFRDLEHDHIGIIVAADENSITVAEGNINNISGIIKRKRNEHIRAYIRLPENFSYDAK